jgi:serine/threonine-protein kinase HipA
MNRCPITYESCGTDMYSRKGLGRLSRRLRQLRDFPYTAEQQRQAAAMRAWQMSIQGVQPKLSARLNVKESVFEVTDRGGRYILKPQHATFPELPQNEDLTMRLGALVGIEVPLHGMIHCADGSLTYFVKRFDRVGRSGKLATEDFAQLAGRYRDTKYKFSMERLASLLSHCTFPMVERLKLLRRSLFNYLVGNEDMHLKNFSLITRGDVVALSPAYDLLNTTIAYLALKRPLDDIEELALPLHGRKRRLTRSLWIDYFGIQHLGLNRETIEDALSAFRETLPKWCALVQRSFLSPAMQEAYVSLLE